MDPKEVKSILECLLFVSDKPLSLATLKELLEPIDRRSLLEALGELQAEYDSQGRAFHLVEIAEGWQLATRVAYAPWIRKLYKSRTANRLSRAALETLAIVAYRQPVSKAEIEDIRGVSADAALGSLLDRRLIRIVGRKEVVGRPLLYGTTREFLHYFGLKDLSDMPELKNLQEMLQQEEAGEEWDLNAQGELIAKIKAREEASAADGPALSEADPACGEAAMESNQAQSTLGEDANPRVAAEDEVRAAGENDAEDEGGPKLAATGRKPKKHEEEPAPADKDADEDEEDEDEDEDDEDEDEFEDEDEDEDLDDEDEEESEEEEEGEEEESKTEGEDPLYPEEDEDEEEEGEDEDEDEEEDETHARRRASYYN